MANVNQDIINKLSIEISDEVGNQIDDDLIDIGNKFNKTLSDALNTYKSSIFDADGFVKKIQEYDPGTDDDKNVIKNILSGVRNEYSSAKSLNHSELLLRYDLYNICHQMPEMNDVIHTLRDAIIECNVSTGQVSRSIVFENNEETDNLENQVKEIERRHDLLTAIKNFIIPSALMHGEMYIQRTPYAKIFAEIEALSDSKNKTVFKESIPNHILNSFKEGVNLYNEDNLDLLMESTTYSSNISSVDEYKIDNNINKVKSEEVARKNLSSILEKIDVYNSSSVLVAEMGVDAAKEFMLKEYTKYKHYSNNKNDYTHFTETMHNFNSMNNKFDELEDEGNIDFKSYSDIKGVYLKYLDGLKIIPIRMDRKVIGYYYKSTTMDVKSKHPGQQSGLVDNSYQAYTRDKRMVDRLADIIIKTFDKKILAKNIQLKTEIIEVIMAHKFHEGKLSFIYIPESEVERIVINEDENGKGHSVLEPSIFAARNYLLLNMFNILFTLNNTTTRIHYLKSSGLDKNYAATVQRAMRKFQARRISIDDIYSYSGVLNKVGGMNEMVLPTGRNDYKALETDTIPAVDSPINMELLESQRKEAISGTPVPYLSVINAIDEVDFAKTLELANTKFLSAVSALKIDFNKFITKLYQFILKYETDIEDNVIQTFRFSFNTIKQPELVITVEMIQNFLQLYELVSLIYYKKNELEDENGNSTYKAMLLKKELAKQYLGQIDFDEIDEVVKRVNINANKFILDDQKKGLSLKEEDIEEINN